MKNENNHQVCTMGDVHSFTEWDNFKADVRRPFETGMAMMDAEKEVDFSIQKTPTLGRRLRINATRSGFNAAETKRHQSAAVLTEIIVNSLEFKNRVLKYKFDTTKKTSQQVYDHMITGEEVLQKGVDYEMDVDVEMYYKKNNTVGYTYPNVTKTWLNRYVTANYDEASIAGNLVHEWLHKLGYGHSSASDHDSVPYAIGYMVRDMIRAYNKGARYTDIYPEVIVTDPVTPTTPDATPVVTPIPTPAPKRVCIRPWWGLGLIKVCNWEK